jgi:hypothetical protein
MIREERREGGGKDWIRSSPCLLVLRLLWSTQEFIVIIIIIIINIPLLLLLLLLIL